MKETTANTWDEFDMCVSEAVDARNRFVNRSGYSAQQRVFGYSHRMPVSLLSDDILDRMVLAEGPGADMERSMEI